jgi:phosphoglucosamine mutase
VSALQILYAMSVSGKSLHELKEGMTKMPQTLVNVPMSSKLDIQGSPSIQQSVADVEATLGDEGRVLLRPSGTEPLVRVMVEGKDERQVRSLAQQIASAVTEACETV